MNDDLKMGYWLGGRDEILYQIVLLRTHGIQETLKLMLDKIQNRYDEKDNPHVQWLATNIDNLDEKN